VNSEYNDFATELGFFYCNFDSCLSLDSLGGQASLRLTEMMQQFGTKNKAAQIRLGKKYGILSYFSPTFIICSEYFLFWKALCCSVLALECWLQHGALKI